jgi:quercetin dioxygenase-like cupin family protein
MDYFFNWQKHAGSQAEKIYKTTLWQGEHVMVGLNCLDPQQVQKVHAHEGADKLYFVLQGSGRFTIGNDERDAAIGELVIAPAGVAHGVVNNGSERLSLLIAIAPGTK